MTDPTPTILQAVTAASEQFSELCALKARHDTSGYQTDGFQATDAQHMVMMFLAAEEWRQAHPAQERTEPKPVNMRVDADWLRRKVEQDPDEECCDLSPPEPAPDDAGLISALDHIRGLERGARALMYQAQGGDPTAVKEDPTLAQVSDRLAALVKERDDEIAARVAAQASVAAQIARAEKAEGRIAEALAVISRLYTDDELRMVLTGEEVA